MNQNSSVRKLARCGVVAAIYVVLCLALQPFSYGAVQVRVAEALCLLPVFGVEYIAGVVLGCFLANLLGSTIVDVILAPWPPCWPAWSPTGCGTSASRAWPWLPACPRCCSTL